MLFEYAQKAIEKATDKKLENGTWFVVILKLRDGNPIPKSVG